jgi:hypothetical protein
VTDATTLRTADGRLRAPIRLAVGSLLVALASTVGAVLAASLAGGGVGEVDRAVLVVGSAVGTTASVLFVAREADGRSLADLGLALDRRWWADLGVGFALGALLLTGVFLALVGGGWARVTRVGPPALVPWLGTLGLFVVVGFYEELFVRGWLLTNVAEGFAWLGDRLASAVAVLASASVFGALHLANPGATPASTLGVTAAGVFLGVAFVRTASLALPVGVHVTWNFVQGAVYGFPVSGIATPTSVVATVRSGPAPFTGGAFGPEASLLGLSASAVGTLAVLAYARRYSPSWTAALAWTTTPDLPGRNAPGGRSADRGDADGESANGERADGERADDDRR